MDTGREAFYFNIYQQRGGAAPIFKGTRFIQYGNGFGDVLRSTERHVLSVAHNQPSTHIDEPSPPHEIVGKRRGKKRKKKQVSSAKTIVYKAPKKKKQKKGKKRSTKKYSSKFRKFNF